MYKIMLPNNQEKKDGLFNECVPKMEMLKLDFYSFESSSCYLK